MRVLGPRRRRGSETLESAFTFGVMLMMMAIVISLFSAFANAMLAQHALSQTALYVAASGRFTDKAQKHCEAMLPSQVEGYSPHCRLLRADGGEIPPAADDAVAIPAAFGSKLSLQVEYQQPWFFICLTGDCANSSPVRLKVGLLSLTQQRQGS